MNAHPQTTAPSPASPARPRNLIIKTVVLMALLAAISIVAYSIYIAVHEPDPQETVILGQTKMAAGSPTGVRILVRNRQSGRPVQGAKVVLTLSGKTNGVIQLGSFTTDASGSTAEAINIPAIPPGDYEFIVDATSSLGRDHIVKKVEIQQPARILLSSDKPSFDNNHRYTTWVGPQVFNLASFDLVPKDIDQGAFADACGARHDGEVDSCSELDG